ncbi:MAG: hypothetical protein L3J39_05080 [Verrucomicrobiales bacterium]|nr:hypothetical protein [Verrucomicrobiales bacterium]
MEKIASAGEVTEQTKQEIMAIQEAIHPSKLGQAIDVTIANIKKYVLPQYKANLFGNIYDIEIGIEAVRSGSMKGHTSIKHDLQFFSSGDTIVCFGLGDGADYDEDGNKISEHLNFPFCDVFVRVDGELRLLAVTASAVIPEGN